MPILDPRSSAVVLVDFQPKLMAAMDQGAAVVANARRLVTAAGLLGVPVSYTEQNPNRLGATLAELSPPPGAVLAKMTFDATRAPGFLDRLPEGAAVLVAGWEAHVCVLQTALGLLHAGRRVYAVCDATSSRRPESKEAALRRLERHGAGIVTTEMVLFEWLGSADHPRFRDVIALVK